MTIYKFLLRLKIKLLNYYLSVLCVLLNKKLLYKKVSQTSFNQLLTNLLIRANKKQYQELKKNLMSPRNNIKKSYNFISSSFLEK